MEDVPEVEAPDMIHDEGKDVVFHVNHLVDFHHVGVLQLCHGFDASFDAIAALFEAAESVVLEVDHFDGKFACEVEVFGAIDGACDARAEDFVGLVAVSKDFAEVRKGRAIGTGPAGGWLSGFAVRA